MIDVAETELLADRASQRRPGGLPSGDRCADHHQRQPGDAGRARRLDQAPVRLCQPGQLPQHRRGRPEIVAVQDSLLPAIFAVASYRASLLPLLGDAAEASLQGADRRTGAPAGDVHAERRNGTTARSACGSDVPRLPLTFFESGQATSPMNDDSQILIARLLTHQTLRRDDKMVKRVLSDELFRAEVDKRLLAIRPEAARQRLCRPRHAGAAPQHRAEDFRRQATSGRTIISACRATAWPCWWCCGRRSSCPSASARKPTSTRTTTRTICSTSRQADPARGRHLDRHLLHRAAGGLRRQAGQEDPSWT
jgi:hypothetical protein